AFDRQGKLDEAIAAYRHAIALKPDFADAYSNLGGTLAEQGKRDEAVAAYRHAIALKPDFADAYSNLGGTLAVQGKREEAVAADPHAIALKPDFAEAQFALCMAELPILYENEPEITVRRTAYERRLNAFCEAGDRSTNLADLAKVVGFSQPFLLAYQGYNDRDLQALYGS